MLVFGTGGKPENLEKNPRSREENQHKLNPLIASVPGIEPGPHWWEASALTTTPPLLLSGSMSNTKIELLDLGLLKYFQYSILQHIQRGNKYFFEIMSICS